MYIFAWILFSILIISTLLFFIFYGKRISWWFYSREPQRRVYSEKLHKFAVIIPARNEGVTICPLLESLNQQTYDSNLIDVYVVVKDPNDPTIDLIHETMHSACIYIDEQQTNKGHALDYGLKKILQSKPNEYDGFMIIDADCILKNTFVSEMNRAFGSQKQVYNSKLVVKNYLNPSPKSNRWSSYCNGLIWTLMSELGNRAKSDQGIVTMTLGTGLLIHADLIQKWNGWPFSQTLTEDTELQRYCAVHHCQTEYVSYAICYVEESTSLRVTNLRRNRWMTGVVSCDHIYDSQLKAQCKTKEGRLNFYAIHSLYYVYRYVGSLCILFLVSLITGIISSIQRESYSLIFYGISGLCFLFLYIEFVLMTIRVMQVDKEFLPMKRRTRVWIVLTNPFYYMGYIGIMIKIFTFKKAKIWHKTKRVEFKENVFKQV